MLGDERTEQFRDDGHDGWVVVADAERTEFSVSGERNAVECAAGKLDEPVGTGQQFDARVCQLHPRRRPPEKLCADRLFQAMDAPSQRRLSHVKPQTPPAEDSALRRPR